MQDTRWHSLQGGIERIADEVHGGEYVAISLWGRNADGIVVGQRTLIEPARLERWFRRTMDFAVQDMERHDIV